MIGDSSRSRWLAGAAAVVVVLLAAWWWARPPEVEGPERAPDGPAAAPRHVPAAAPVGSLAAPPPATEAADPASEAMGALARAEGRGHLRCPIGDVVSGPVRGAGLVRPRVAGGVLLAQVESERGSSAVYAEVTGPGTLVAVELPGGQLGFAPDAAGAEAEDDASLPRARIRWTGATPGALGTCTVDPVEPVEFVVATADGGDSFGATTDGGCAVVSARSSLPDGRFVVRGARGVPCELTLLRSDLDEEGTRVVLTGSVQVEDPRPDAAYPVELSAVSGPEEAPGEGDKDEAGPSPEAAWEAALGEQDLSPEARAVLERWQEDEFEKADEIGRGWQALGEQMGAAAGGP